MSNHIMFIDLETTGLPLKNKFNKFYSPRDFIHYDNCRIVEIAYIICALNGDIIKTVTSLIKPTDFTITNSNIHGITHENALSNGNDLTAILKDFENDLNMVNTIIAHNIVFDHSVLLSECYRNKLAHYNIIEEISKKKLLCTMVMGKTFLNTYKYPKLVDLYKNLFDIDVDNNHRALIDTNMCKNIYFKMISSYNE